MTRFWIWDQEGKLDLVKCGRTVRGLLWWLGLGRDPGSIPGLGTSHGEENGYTPVLLPGEFQMNLAGYIPWGHKELDMTEWHVHMHTHTHTHAHTHTNTHMGTFLKWHNRGAKEWKWQETWQNPKKFNTILSALTLKKIFCLHSYV